MIIRKLGMNDKSKLNDLIIEVEKNLINDTFWLPITKISRDHFFDEEWTYFLGAFEGDELIGAVALFFNENEFGESRKILEIDSTNLAEYGRAMVKPSFQGKGIMKMLSKQIIEYAGSIGIQRIIATVHPSNISSQMVVKFMGFQKKGFVKKNNIYDRDIFLLEI